MKAAPKGDKGRSFGQSSFVGVVAMVAAGVRPDAMLSRPARPLRILVADDDAVIQDWYRRVLTQQGHEVVGVAGTGEELIHQCELTSPDLIITDIMMPEMDGITAANRIFDRRPVPILVVSGHMDEEIIERAAKLSIAGVMVKPIAASSIKVQIDLAKRRFEEYQGLLRRIDQPMRDR